MEYFYNRLKVLEQQDKPLSQEERILAISGPLFDWYEKNARVLPWRDDPQPYMVWISEIMLQQTRVEAVKPYFERFLNALPDVKALASVEEEKLLKLWEGLGYYNRARNLKKAAVIMEEQFNGMLPDRYEALLSLPGIGSYTAGAIASIAYGIPVPAVDGNVLRVLSRILGSKEDILKQSTKKSMEALLSKVMPRQKVSQYNQGLIEIGAIICIPNGKPRCGECPFSSVCVACREGLTEEIPVKTPKKPRKIQDLTVFLVEKSDRIAINKRNDKGLLASLYEYPNCQGLLQEDELPEALGINQREILSVEPLMDSSHIFTHVEWHMKGYRVKVKNQAVLPWLMVTKKQLFEEYPIPKAFLAYTSAIQKGE